jgi:hypothetical protein
LNISNLGLGKVFLDTTKNMGKKGKNRLDFVNIKKFYSSKNIIKTVQRQLTEWEKIYANYIFYRGIVHKEFTTQQ